MNLIAYNNLPLYHLTFYRVSLLNKIFSKGRNLFNKIDINLLGRKIVYEYRVIPVYVK